MELRGTAIDDPRLSPSPAARLALATVATLALVFTAGTFLAPLLIEAGAPAARLIAWIYTLLCHQLPERSLEIGRSFQAVCTRCSGLYLGGTAGLLLAWALALGTWPRRQARWFWLAVLPTVIDAGLGVVGAPSLSNLPRMLLAVPAGLLAGLFLAAGIADLFRRRDDVITTTRAPQAPASAEVLDG